MSPSWNLLVGVGGVGSRDMVWMATEEGPAAGAGVAGRVMRDVCCVTIEGKERRMICLAGYKVPLSIRKRWQGKEEKLLKTLEVREGKIN